MNIVRSTQYLYNGKRIYIGLDDRKDNESVRSFEECMRQMVVRDSVIRRTKKAKNAVRLEKQD